MQIDFLKGLPKRFKVAPKNTHLFDINKRPHKSPVPIKKEFWKIVEKKPFSIPKHEKDSISKEMGMPIVEPKIQMDGQFENMNEKIIAQSVWQTEEGVPNKYNQLVRNQLTGETLQDIQKEDDKMLADRSEYYKILGELKKSLLGKKQEKEEGIDGFLKLKKKELDNVESTIKNKWRTHKRRLDKIELENQEQTLNKINENRNRIKANIQKINRQERIEKANRDDIPTRKSHSSSRAKPTGRPFKEPKKSITTEASKVKRADAKIKKEVKNALDDVITIIENKDKPQTQPEKGVEKLDIIIEPDDVDAFKTIATGLNNDVDFLIKIQNDVLFTSAEQSRVYDICKLFKITKPRGRPTEYSKKELIKRAIDKGLSMAITLSNYRQSNLNSKELRKIVFK